MRNLCLLSFLLLLASWQAAAEVGGTYGPLRGEKTLEQIANELHRQQADYRDFSASALILALWRANPEAFSASCNLNTLKKNVTLKLPAATMVASISKNDAATEIKRQSQEWRRTRKKGLKCPELQVAPIAHEQVVVPLKSEQPVTSPISEQPAASYPPEKLVTPLISTQPVIPPVSVFPDLGWLDLPEKVVEHWDIAAHPQDPHWLQIKLKDHAPRHHIFAIISKKSSSYSLGLTKILEVFGQKGIPAEFTVANIDNQDDLASSVLSYVEDHLTNLIFSIGSESADYLSKNYNRGKIPMVTCINKDPVLLGQIQNYDAGHEGNIVYTSINVPLPIYLSYLKTLRPNLKAVGLMYDRKHKQVMVTEVVPTLKGLAAEGIKVVEVPVGGADAARDQLAERIPQAMEELRVIDPELNNVLFWMTSSTAVFSNIKTVNAYSGSIPVVASIPNAVVEGEDSAVLGIGIDRRSNAHQAALYAIQILTQGTPPGSFEVGIVAPPDIAVNFLVARRIGLKIPFRFFENASFIYDYSGRVVRDFGVKVVY